MMSGGRHSLQRCLHLPVNGVKAAKIAKEITKTLSIVIVCSVQRTALPLFTR